MPSAPVRPTSLPRPSKPLKLLTIDGGGLQAISALVILDKLLDTIALENKVKNKRPRPCDVFDAIAGIGAGGWLALLLGRFNLDITACLSEWYSIIRCIQPRSKSEEMRMRILQQCYYSTDSLMQRIDKLIRVYGTGKTLIDSEPPRTRCRHVFVAALNTDTRNHSRAYNLFRTYECPKDGRFLEGPGDPKNYEISRAFAATGAAKYFTPPWKEYMENGRKAKFSDVKFPCPHNITELMLDEMWQLYGHDVPISVIVNIGPGLPNKSDIRHIAQRFSWGRNFPSNKENSASERLADRKRNAKPPSNDKGVAIKQYETGQESRVQFASGNIDVKRFQAGGERKDPLDRRNTNGSIIDRDMDDKLRRLEAQIEEDVKKKIRSVYPINPPPYYRLALEIAPPATAQNDASAPGLVLDATNEYLNTRNVEVTLERLSSDMSE